MKKAQATPPPNSGNTKVTREQWLDLALQTLISHGVEDVLILALAQKLGVSRSSFYWYFKSRQDLLNQLLERWRETNTQAILERAARPAPTIIRAVMNVFECWADQRLFNPQLDFAIRSWARRSKAVRKSIDAADNGRLSAIRDMYLRYGYEAEDALIRARVLYYTQIGYFVLDPHESPAVRLSHLDAYLRSFTGQEPTRADIQSFQDYLKRSRIWI